MKEESIETLKEAYFDLEKSRQRERDAKELAQLLRDGINIVSDQSESKVSFEKLFLLLRKKVDMDGFCILQLFSNETSGYRFKPFFFGEERVDARGEYILPDFLAKKFDQKRVANLFDLKSEHGIDQVLSPALQKDELFYRSAIISPINTSTTKYLVILSSKRKSNFTASNTHLINEFTPIFLQAFEMNQLIVDVIMKNKLASFGELSAGIAHEINNPLSVLSTNISLMKRYISLGDKESLDKVTAYLDKSVKMVDRISNIIRGFRVLARDEQVANMDEVSLGDFVTSVQSLCAGNISDNDIAFEINLPVDLKGLVFKINTVQLSQVIINLIINSIDSIKNSDEKWILMEVSKVDKDLVLSIIDSGHGIPQDVAASIFQPFYTTKKLGEGTGLGLSISKNIVESMGGELILDTSQYNTCFSLKIPLASSEE